MMSKKLIPLVNVVIYFILLGAAMIIAGLIRPLNSPLFFFCLSFVLSFIFLRREGKNITSIGFIPKNSMNYLQLFLGLGIGVLMLIVTASLTFLLTGDQWVFSDRINAGPILTIFLNCFCSSFAQEFVFRGYPFQSLHRHYGAWPAQLVVMVPFGLMHVHLAMPFGDFMLTLLTTGVGSLLFGLLYLKTKKLFLPIGLHTGWNFAQTLIPRTSPGEIDGIIHVTQSQHHYNFFTVVLPYLICIALAFILFWQYRTKLSES
ncbi:CPBP family intramembrane metalloprotease [Olivibacter sp. LS-1]|uniref:CPBP family intramembrane glutamic endopeptidase n=1 Tax=unclassified Olivibacter TaxID=2632301 RepID=UPI0011EB71E2|nr:MULTISPECIES: type II CAAX endopeptidase family protein [unclassified Olivibacter]MDM8172865.1 type II CAAX endopeptidase family protein [Olivibacter sp. 47]QEL02733.1 CPBP family intramembrane metalloprotease [Olivibacter sp. LS-1]